MLYRTIELNNSNVSSIDKMTYCLFLSEQFFNQRILTDIAIRNITPEDVNKQEKNINNHLPFNIIKNSKLFIE